MKEARTIKAISFSHDDDYENELYTYATDPARGKFSTYIKRLIDRDRAGLAGNVAVGQAQAVPMVVATPAPASVGKSIAKAFL